MLPREMEVFPKNPEILRSIERGHIEFIQRNIKVNYNNQRQRPVSFYYEDKEHRVIEVQGIFRGDLSLHDVSYLVKTQSGDFYLLHIHFFDAVSQSPVTPCQWVLDFRVLRDEELMSLYREEKAMLVDTRLKMAADFHGHLCPDLVIGWRACRLALKILSGGTLMSQGDTKNNENNPPSPPFGKESEFSGEKQIEERLTIIAENNTAALDAIQYMFGCTVGNQRLQVLDTGQHNYIFISNQARQGFKLSLKELYFADKNQYCELGRKIIHNQATITDMAAYQALLDNRIKKLLELSDKDLFAVQMVNVCPFCGDYVLTSRLVAQGGYLICKWCLSRLKEASVENTYH